jgi:Anti-sigma-28 factor, FlgM
MSWGDHPIDGRPAGADAARMTVLEIPYITRDGLTDLDRELGQRFARRSPPSLDDSRTTRMQQLRQSIESGTYEVDAGAVAAAIIARLVS